MSVWSKSEWVKTVKAAGYKGGKLSLCDRGLEGYVYRNADGAMVELIRGFGKEKEPHVAQYWAPGETTAALAKSVVELKKLLGV